MPRRMQRIRGRRMAEGAVYVGRPTMWGNPYRVVRDRGGWNVTASPRNDLRMLARPVTRRLATIYAVAQYMALFDDPARASDARRWLRGRDLVCWCRPDEPCHADVLLMLANGGE